MTESNLQKKLRDLHDEIGRTDTDDPEKQATLDELQSLVQQAMDQPEDHHKRSLRERLNDSILEFEVEHSSLTETMETMCEYLSSLGI